MSGSDRSTGGSSARISLLQRHRRLVLRYRPRVLSSNAFPLCCWVLTAVCWLTLPSVARADPVQLDYQIENNLDCPSEREFKAQVEGRLGDDPFRERAERTVVVSIGATARGPSARVSWRTPKGPLPGVRRFEPRGQTCGALVSSIVFAVTVQIELLQVEHPEDMGPPGEAPQPTGSTASQPPIPTQQAALPTQQAALPTQQAALPTSAGARDLGRQSPTTPPDNGPRRWSAGAAGLVLLGWFPKVGFGAKAFVTRTQASVSVEAAAEMAFPTRLERSDGSGFQISSWAGTLAPCLNSKPLMACGVLRLGRVQANGFGVDQSRSSAGLLSQVGARLVVSQPFGKSVLGSVYGEGLGNITRGRVVLDRTEVWLAPPVSAAFGLSVSASFF
jgi:hypothetical protein